MLGKKPRRLSNEVNAGSMADIAFLLLIFFLVTTTILTDKGISVRLPPWQEYDLPVKFNEDNVLSIMLNARNQLLAEGELIQTDQIRLTVKDFILNPQKDPNKPSKPTKAIISLQNDRGTSYESYIEVYNELKASYRELWEESAQRDYQQTYQQLPSRIQSLIRAEIPLVISEGEPIDYLVLE